jgi:sulfide:quinone oxidoreductase
MSGQTVAIVGGGVGGIVAANELADRLPQGHRVVLVERSAQHAFAPSFLWLMTGDRRPAQITRDLRSLLRPRVELVQSAARSVDVAAARIATDAGSLAYDHLVLAVGAELAPEAIPGLAETAHTFYTLEGATGLYEALSRFESGRIVVVVSSLPYKCPGAPHEGAMLIADFFRRQGRRDKVQLDLYTPEPQPLPVAGPELGKAVEQMLASRGISFRPAHKLSAVDPAKRELSFDGKPTVAYDLLVAIPPHRGPRLLKDSGLANDAGWVPVDRDTLATRQDGVYAIGDATAIPIPGRWRPDTPLMLPKAGVFAHAQALTVARRLAAKITGTSTDAAFCGDGYCMLEAGEDLAGFASGNFFAEPSPELRLHRIGKAWHLGKVLFERWWLSAPGIRRSSLGLALEIGGRAYGIPVEL